MEDSILWEYKRSTPNFVKPKYMQLQLSLKEKEVVRPTKRGNGYEGRKSIPENARSWVSTKKHERLYVFGHPVFQNS